MAPTFFKFLRGESINSTTVNPETMYNKNKKGSKDDHDCAVISVGSSCSSSSMSSSNGECEPSLESKMLRHSLLCRYRERINFSMFPIPKRVGHLSFKITVSDSHYNLALLNCDSLILMQATKLRVKSIRNLLSKHAANKHFELHFAGALETQLGDVVICKDGAKVCAKSFCTEFDKMVDGKGRVCTHAHELGEAELHEICSLNKNSVSLDGVREVNEWDGLHSITGFYGIESCWPYECGTGHKEFIHQSLYNERGRKIEFLGEKHNNFACTIDSEGNLVHPQFGNLIKTSKLEKDEYELQVSWPLSPVQAFGLFVAYAESR